MADSAASSGLGMFLTPAQGAATASGKTSSLSFSGDVSDENISPFSSVLAEQQEPAKDAFVTRESAGVELALVIEEQKSNLDAVLDQALDGGQTLPLVGNGLPVPGFIPPPSGDELVDITINTSALTGSAFLGDTSLSAAANNPAGASAETSAFDANSIVGQIVQPAVSESQADTAAQTPGQQTPQTAATTTAQTPVDPSALAVLPPVQAVQTNAAPVTPVTQATTQDDDDGAASLSLISMLDRKSKVGAELKSDKPLVASADLNSSTDVIPSDDLLLNNLQTDTSSNLGDDVGNLQQKNADLTSLLSAKPQNSMEINSLSTWRQQGAQSYGSNQPASVTTAPIDIPVGKAGWGEAVLDKVMWMSSQKMDSAEIALDPADLGPMHVRITTHQDQTTVVFTSHHAQVRDALDQASAQLRQNLENQGFSQVNVDVSGQNANQQMAGQSQSEGSGNSSENLTDESQPADTASAAVTGKSMRLGLVDTFV